MYLIATGAFTANYTLLSYLTYISIRALDNYQAPFSQIWKKKQTSTKRCIIVSYFNTTNKFDMRHCKNICLNRPYHFKFFKGCLPQILLGSFLNTLSYIYDAKGSKKSRNPFFFFFFSKFLRNSVDSLGTNILW